MVTPTGLHGRSAVNRERLPLMCSEAIESTPHECFVSVLSTCDALLEMDEV